MKAIISLLVSIFLIYSGFSLHDINLQDDSFHSNIPFHIETWYFEAIFENNYSTVFMVTSLSNGSKGLLLLGLYIYKDGILKIGKRVIETNFYLSSETPLLMVKGKEIMKGYLKEGKIGYHINFSLGENSIDLIFLNRTKGWKTDFTLRGWWLAIPNMEVKGKIKLNDSLIKVKGKGYHDHNIVTIFSPFLSKGHIFGKVIQNNFSLACGELLYRLHTEDFFIFNNKSYAFLHDLSLKKSKFIMDHWRVIPTEFIVKGKDKERKIYVNIDCKAIDFHFIRLPFIHYWRYHVRAKGFIRINGKGYNISSMEMIEYLLYQQHI